MAKVVASGKYMGRQVKVEVTFNDKSQTITLDGEADEFAQKYYDSLFDTIPAFGGTFFPDKDSPLAAYGILKEKFFDIETIPEVEIIGEVEPIPSEPGVIY